MRNASISFGFAALSLALALQARCEAATPIRIELDATQAPSGLLHSHMTIPATGGTLTLAYPKWIPGEHSPGGPLSQVIRLSFSANGKPLTWNRDDLDIFVFHVEVPPGVSQIQADLDFACVLGQEGFQSDIWSTCYGRNGRNGASRT